MILRFIISLLFFLPYTAMAADITALRMGAYPDKTRLVLDMTGAMDFEAKMMDAPERLVLYMPVKEWSVPQTVIFASPFDSIHQDKVTGDMMRLTLPLNNPAIIQSAFMIEGAGDEANRLVIDVTPVNDLEFSRNIGVSHGTLSLVDDHNGHPANDLNHLIATIANDSGDGGSAATNNMTTGNQSSSLPVQKPKPRKRPIIVIDAGHGGKDPGAISPRGLKEKDITLSMARTVADYLNRTGRYDARLTRNDDRYIKLYNRVKIAQKAGADLFISIHADSVGDHKTKGASVYTLSDTASDAQTAKLAARENRADLIGGLDLNIEDKDVSAILIDLSMRETMNQSKKLANKIVMNMATGGIPTLQGPHRYAGFAVLKAPDIPAILIETGFVSNESEARRLMNPDYQKQMSKALLQSIDSHFKD